MQFSKEFTHIYTGILYHYLKKCQDIYKLICFAYIYFFRHFKQTNHLDKCFSVCYNSNKDAFNK